jgi:PAS domain S-box-containing protein
MATSKVPAYGPDLLAQLASREARIAELETRLVEAEDTLQAIRTGQIDALVVSGPEGDHIFALEGADHTYRVLVEEMQEGTVTCDADGLILYSNRQFASMVGIPVETIVGSRFQRFLAPEKESHFTEFLAEAGARRSRSELALRAGDGMLVPVNVSLSRLETAGIQTICAVITDLTEQRHYEAMLREGELSRLILDQAAEAILVIDARGIILRASEAARYLAGHNILRQHFDAAFSLWEPEHCIDAARLLSAAVAGDGLRSIELQLLQPDRPASSLLLSAGPLWSESRELLGCVVTLIDITERKRSEEALALQARALERSNNDLRQFAYAVSHDLREPARNLAIYSQLFEEKYKGKFDGEADRFIQQMVQSAYRLEGLLDDLLTYTQTAGAAKAVETALDANVALAKALAVFEAAFSESGARIEVDPLPWLRVEEVHLQQLFQNLIGNSLKYRGETPPVIRISAQPSGSAWKLTVEDNGIGIDPQYHKQIFGLFKRLHGGTKYTGSGMGLAICQQIVERYGGRIWLESELGQGSKFFFTLPGEPKAAESLKA